jgi:DNA-binding transcriptional regulator YdaS (Cro superfamily)
MAAKAKARRGVLGEVIKAAGGVSALAHALSIERQAVSKWTRVPLERVVKVSKITGIPREKIRPDLYA